MVTMQTKHYAYCWSHRGDWCGYLLYPFIVIIDYSIRAPPIVFPNHSLSLLRSSVMEISINSFSLNWNMIYLSSMQLEKSTLGYVKQSMKRVCENAEQHACCRHNRGQVAKWNYIVHTDSLGLSAVRWRNCWCHARWYTSLITYCW